MGTALIGPLVGLVGQAIGGGKSGSAATGAPSSVTPQEAALAEYQTTQQELANATKFSMSSSGSGGMGMSTGKTFADAGAQFGGAEALAKIGDTNASSLNALAQTAANAQQATGSTTTGNLNFGNTQGTGGDTSGTGSDASGNTVT